MNAICLCASIIWQSCSPQLGGLADVISVRANVAHFDVGERLSSVFARLDPRVLFNMVASQYEKVVAPITSWRRTRNARPNLNLAFLNNVSQS